MKQSWCTLLLAAVAILVAGCRPRTAGDVAGVYASQRPGGQEEALQLNTNGSYEHLLSSFDGNAVGAKTNFMGTWTFDSTQNLVILNDALRPRAAYVFDDRSTQATLVLTSTPTLPVPVTTYQIARGGTNVSVTASNLDVQPFYRRPIK